MKPLFTLLSVLLLATAGGQELYPFADPASNNPARSLSLKAATMVHGDVHSSRTLHRHMQDVSLGLSKDLMLRLGTGFSNMHQRRFMWDGARAYAKYRFLSNDDVHKHFRLAAFALAAYSRNHLDHNEINLPMGDQSGVQAGLIATQLWNKFALSATGSWNEVLDRERWEKDAAGRWAVQSVNYSLSAGYLLFPRSYKGYNQTNLNLYAELIGSRNINFEPERYYVDLMPSVQAIFNSAAKLNLGYRFELGSDIYRLTRNSWMVSFEYLFLNALKRKRSSK